MLSASVYVYNLSLNIGWLSSAYELLTAEIAQ